MNKTKRLGILFAVIMALAMVLAWAIPTAASASPPAQVSIPKGDANGDGLVNMGDVPVIVQMVLGQRPVKSWADANWDGDVNMADVTKVVRVWMGLEQVVP